MPVHREVYKQDMVVESSMILDLRTPPEFSNMARGKGQQRIVFETADEIAPGSTVRVIVLKEE